MHNEKKLNPFNIVVFGGDGDLSFRKIYPAFFHRFIDGQLSCDFNIYAISRSSDNTEEFLSRIRSFIEKSIDYDLDLGQIDVFFKHISLIKIAQPSIEDYTPLKAALSNNDYQNIYYLSTPSSAFGDISDMLKKNDLIKHNSKVVLEKPLGFSLESSQNIHETLHRSFKEKQIYRIDHYLGKETVQNLMVLRFANHLFEHSWSSEHINSVHITVSESIGVESRGDYYEQSGALLDMVQNHLLQLLCLIAMEPPSKLDANSVRNEKLKVLNSIRHLDTKSVQTDTAKGQYSRGQISNSNGNLVQVSSYLEDINKFDSDTETFVAIKAYIDNWRWKGTPFYLRTGKRMESRYSEIVVNFNPVKHNLFPSQGELAGNTLVIRLQPEERIELVQMTKVPGPGGYRYKPISLKLDFLDSFKERLPEAYERLIIDVIRGEQTLFMRQDELEAAWSWIESIKTGWADADTKNVLYEAGTNGPGDTVLENGHSWKKQKADEV
jgi:glucose-6-phosphate 1-dehydrogenase